jgi:heparin binding hemagglutinin HbhA
MAPTTLPRSVYAVAGAGDLAAEQLKKLAANAPELQARAAVLPAELRKLAAEFPRDLQNLAADLPSLAAQLQARARDLDVDTVTAAVRKNVETAQHKAVDVYGDLVERGQKFVAKRQNGTPGTDVTPADIAPSGVTPAEAKKPIVKKNVAAKKTTPKATS